MNIGLYQIQFSCGTDKWITDYQTFSCVSMSQILLWFFALLGLLAIYYVIKNYFEMRKDFDEK